MSSGAQLFFQSRGWLAVWYSAAMTACVLSIGASAAPAPYTQDNRLRTAVPRGYAAYYNPNGALPSPTPGRKAKYDPVVRAAEKCFRPWQGYPD